MLDRARILAATDRPVVTVEVPEWGGQVCLRALTGAEARLLHPPGEGAIDGALYAARLVALSLCDEGGARILGLDDVPALLDRHQGVLTRLMAVATTCSAMRSSAEDEKKASAPTAS